eukprot:469170_1
MEVSGSFAIDITSIMDGLSALNTKFDTIIQNDENIKQQNTNILCHLQAFESVQSLQTQELITTSQTTAAIIGDYCLNKNDKFNGEQCHIKSSNTKEVLAESTNTNNKRKTNNNKTRVGSKRQRGSESDIEIINPFKKQKNCDTNHDNVEPGNDTYAEISNKIQPLCLIKKPKQDCRIPRLNITNTNSNKNVVVPPPQIKCQATTGVTNGKNINNNKPSKRIRRKSKHGNTNATSARPHSIKLPKPYSIKLAEKNQQQKLLKRRRKSNTIRTFTDAQGNKINLSKDPDYHLCTSRHPDHPGMKYWWKVDSKLNSGGVPICTGSGGKIPQWFLDTVEEVNNKQNTPNID